MAELRAELVHGEKELSLRTAHELISLICGFEQILKNKLFDVK